MRNRIIALLSAFGAILALSQAGVAWADSPGAHPAFLHALTDLRTARFHLEKRGGSEALKASDHKAVEEIDACINDIKKASIDDGKNLNDHPAEDDGKDKVGDVHRARELLDRARHDIDEKETNPAVKDLRGRALHHLEEALRHIDESIKIAK